MREDWLKDHRKGETKMNKELTPLEHLEFLRQYEINEEHHCLNDQYVCRKSFDIIEKSLKALEIIKEKNVDVGELLGCILLEKQEYIKDALEEFNRHLLIHNQITQEQFDLLKEVLL